MERDFRNTLAIMEQIELDGSQSQRHISRKVGLALGLTNAYLKRLVTKGHVMVSSMPARRIWYNLTPKGIAEKARLTMLYMKDSVDLYAELKRKVGQAVIEMERRGVRSVALLGEGEILEVALLCLLDSGIKLAGLFSYGTQLKQVARRQVKPLERLSEIEYDALLLAEFNVADRLLDRLTAAGVERSQVMLLNGAWLNGPEPNAAGRREAAHR